MKKVLISLVLILALLPLGAFAYTDIPLVEGDEPVTLSIVRPYQYNSRPTDELWFWDFAEKCLNIKFDVETTENKSSYVQLSFAAGTMPDIYNYMGLSSADLMLYGCVDGLIVDLAPYIDNGTMKNLAAVYEKHPTYRSQITAPNGAIYALGLVRDSLGYGDKVYWNTRWLSEAGYGIPTTLDELVEVVYAIKEQRGDEVTPLSGGYNTNNPLFYVLNAFGYVTNKSNGSAACLRDGKVVIPYGDREVFGDYLTLVNQFYNDGIISHDYYTIDENTFRALIGEDKGGFMATAPYVYEPVTFDEWDAVIPLKSKYNNYTSLWQGENAVTTGNALISSNCENVEVAVRFLDWFYDAENNILANNGPTTNDTDYLLGVGGWYIDEDYVTHFVDFEAGDTGFESTYDYRMGRICGTHWEFGVDQQEKLYQQMFGLEPIGIIYDPLDGDANYHLTCEENLAPYTVEGFPKITFFDAEVVERMSDLKISLNDYALEECAKFITGARSLDTLDDYFDTLDSMGFQEYLQYYVDYYEAYTSK